jgi:hypothetical protein
MPRVPETTDRQTLFLRAFRTNPAGPDPADWPSPAILRRWLRKPAFIAALRSVQTALRFQTDFQLSSAANNAARKLAHHDADLSTQDLNRLLRHAHLRQRFNLNADVAKPTHARDENDDDQHNDDEENSTPPEPQYIVFGTNNRPIWVGDRALLNELAFQEGYTAPLRDWPNFPKPAPQDTFYYHLLQDPAALLWYMQLYDQSGNNDHRYKPILMHCKILIPHESPPDHTLPHFQSETPSPQEAQKNN